MKYAAVNYMPQSDYGGILSFCQQTNIQTITAQFSLSSERCKLLPVPPLRHYSFSPCKLVKQ